MGSWKGQVALWGEGEAVRRWICWGTEVMGLIL